MDKTLIEYGRVAALRIRAGKRNWGDAEALAEAYEELTRVLDLQECRTPDDCPLGPDPHLFIPPDRGILCCCRQPWEK